MPFLAAINEFPPDQNSLRCCDNDAKLIRCDKRSLVTRSDQVQQFQEAAREESKAWRLLFIPQLYEITDCVLICRKKFDLPH